MKPITFLLMVSIVPACADQEPEWAQSAQRASVGPCAELSPPPELAPVRGTAWWDGLLGLTFEDITARDLRACWSYVPAPDGEAGGEGEARAVLTLEPGRWESSPGVDTVVGIETHDVMTIHADRQPSGDGDRLAFELEGQILTAIDQEWSAYRSD